MKMYQRHDGTVVLEAVPGEWTAHFYPAGVKPGDCFRYESELEMVADQLDLPVCGCFGDRECRR